MLVLAAIGVKPGNIPFDVISIIMAVIAAISPAMQVAGLDYLVHQTEKLLRRNRNIHHDPHADLRPIS